MVRLLGTIIRLAFGDAELARRHDFVASEHSDQAIGVLRRHQVSEGAVQIGVVRGGPLGQVSCRGSLGVARAIDMLNGEQLPRTC